MGEGILTGTDNLLERIAEQVGTPTYVYDAAAIGSQIDKLHAALANTDHRIHYSIKANGNLAILNLMQRLGVGADIVSGGELQRALKSGFAPSEIVFSGVGKTLPEIREAMRAGVGLINIESEAECEQIISVAHDDGHTAALGIRINPDVTTVTHPYTQTGASGMKFGVPMDRVLAVAKQISDAPSVKLVSIGMHIGSQISAARSYGEGAEKLAEMAEQIREQGIDTLTSIDVGGGMAIPYAGDGGLDLNEFANAVLPVVRKTNLTLIVEPGRLLIGNAGILLTRVLHVKRSGGRCFAVVDAGMNDFARPSYYGAEHPIDVIRPSTSPGGSEMVVDVVGPICETGDYLGLERRLPGVGPGALLGIRGAGAYGFTMSSTYNSRPRAAEVLLDSGRAGLIRTREAVEDLWRGELGSPEWLDGQQGEGGV